MAIASPLKHFATPKAKIDFITLRIPSSLDIDGAYLLHKAVKGRIEVPGKHWGNWFTIHDPAIKDLQYLLDHHPECEIQGFEFAIDFKLADGSSDKARLVELHNWLTKRLFPQRDERMELVGRRKYYDLRLKKVLPDALKTKNKEETTYWTNNTGFEQIRLYIKTEDNHKPLEHHFVRLEATLSRGGCQNAGISHVSELPCFANGMRRELSKFFYVAAGIKPNLKRSRSSTPTKVVIAAEKAKKEMSRVELAWETMGAAWAAKHGYSTIPDAPTNRRIGIALKELREGMMSLKLTRKVADLPSYEIMKSV